MLRLEQMSESAKQLEYQLLSAQALAHESVLVYRSLSDRESVWVG